MPESNKQQSLVAYVPALHRGYLDYFRAYPKAESIYLIDRTTIAEEEVDYLRKELRQLDVSEALAAIKGLGRFKKVEVYDDKLLSDLDTPSGQIIMPDEDISHIVGEKFQKAEVNYYSVFLRWDRRKLEDINKTDESEAPPTTDIKHVANMGEALRAAEDSTDIWRRVGAVLVSNEEIIDKASNTAEPNKLSPWLEGDPRNAFNRGVGIEMSVFTHAEALMVARAAKHGASLEGASLYVTDYPCPACAKLIAHSGISELYYKDGYAVLDGKRVLDEYGVSVRKVQIEGGDDSNPEVWVPYEKKK